MQKNSVNLFLLALVFLLNSCDKKRDISKEPIQFEVSGVHDVVIDSSNRNVMSITINQTSGYPEPVTIEVPGLPPGIQAYTMMSSGIPPFSTTVHFWYNGTRPSGVFNVSLAASSQHCFKDYRMNVISPVSDFDITGAHDIVLNSLTDTIPITVTYISGMREMIELHAILPGIFSPNAPQCKIVPEKGKPDFSSKFIFFRFTDTTSTHRPTKPGTYRWYIMASNSSTVKYDSLNVTVL